jgi:hypothetical protein
MKRQDVIGRGVGVVLVFAGAGPLIGGFVFGLLWIVQVLIDPAEPWRAAYFSTPIYAALLGYLAGFAPAAATGAVASVASLRISMRRIWIAFTAVVGAAFSAVNLVLLRNGYPTTTPGVWDVIQIMAIGAISALICAMICEGFRPLSRRRRA